MVSLVLWSVILFGVEWVLFVFALLWVCGGVDVVGCVLSFMGWSVGVDAWIVWESFVFLSDVDSWWVFFVIMRAVMDLGG